MLVTKRDHHTVEFLDPNDWEDKSNLKSAFKIALKYIPRTKITAFPVPWNSTRGPNFGSNWSANLEILQAICKLLNDIPGFIVPFSLLLNRVHKFLLKKFSTQSMSFFCIWKSLKSKKNHYKTEVYNGIQETSTWIDEAT